MTLDEIDQLIRKTRQSAYRLTPAFMLDTRPSASTGQFRDVLGEWIRQVQDDVAATLHRG